MGPFFSGDLHLHHRNIIEYCKRPWNSVEEMNEALIKLWNQTVGSNDSVYLAGDVVFGGIKKAMDVLPRLNGKKYLVKGNHDHNYKKEEFAKHFEWIKDYYELRVSDPDAPHGSQLIVLCHYAFYVWRDSHLGSWCLSGHSHGSADDWHAERLSLDVGVDARYTNYKPISYEQVKAIMRTKKMKVVDHHNEYTNR